MVIYISDKLNCADDAKITENIVMRANISERNTAFPNDHRGTRTHFISYLHRRKIRNIAILKTLSALDSCARMLNQPDIATNRDLLAVIEIERLTALKDILSSVIEEQKLLPAKCETLMIAFEQLMDYCNDCDNTASVYSISQNNAVSKTETLLTSAKPNDTEPMNTVPTLKIDTLEPSLAELLDGESFVLLRQTLEAEGITTMAQFQATDPWVFMNRHSLYSIAQRYSTLSILRERLSKVVSDEAKVALHQHPDTEDDTAKNDHRGKPDVDSIHNTESDPASKQQSKPLHLDSNLTLRKEIETAVLAEDLTGVTIRRLYEMFPRLSEQELNSILSTSECLIKMPEKVVHIKAFVDMDETMERVGEILEKLMERNLGYVSAAQLYANVSLDLSMFLSENAVDREQDVYALARHFYGRPVRQRYRFTETGRIFRAESEEMRTNADIYRHFAQSEGGFFSYQRLAEYAHSIGMKTGSLRQQMQIGIKPVYLCYSSDEFVLTETLGIDAAWLDRTDTALRRLFEDMGDHVVLRSIRDIWYQQLPALPAARLWTPLLLQYILKFYGEQLRARTIKALDSQRNDTLHCMIVSIESEVQTFPDAVIAFLIDNGISQRTFSGEELRRLLVNGQLIAGNELFHIMPKALSGDPRFAWDAAGEMVKVLV